MANMLVASMCSAAERTFVRYRLTQPCLTCYSSAAGSQGTEDDDSIRRLPVLAGFIAAIFDPIEGAVPAAAGATAAGAWTGVLDIPSRALPGRPDRCNRGVTTPDHLKYPLVGTIYPGTMYPTYEYIHTVIHTVQDYCTYAYVA